MPSRSTRASARTCPPLALYQAPVRTAQARQPFRQPRRRAGGCLTQRARGKVVVAAKRCEGNDKHRAKTSGCAQDTRARHVHVRTEDVQRLDSRNQSKTLSSGTQVITLHHGHH